MCSIGSSILPQILALLRDHRPEGIPLMDISNEFLRMFGYRLNPRDYNCNNLNELIEKLAENCGKALLLVKHNTNNFKSDRIFVDDEAYDQWIQTLKIQRDFRVLKPLVSHLIPEDVIQSPGSIPILPHSLPSNALDPNGIISFRAEVIYVENPYLMFVRLFHNKDVYNNLRHSLRFYDGTEEQIKAYNLPKELAVEGYLCAVKNPMDWENWHRAIIVKAVGEKITLFAVDFGNIIIQNRKELRLLKQTFCSVPPQAIRVSLAGIAPTSRGGGDKPYVHKSYPYVWPKDSVEYLKSLVEKYKSEIHCIFLQSIPNRQNYFSVFLHTAIDLEKEDVPNFLTVYFHELLIKNGFAEMIPFNADLKDFNDNNNYEESIVSEAIEEPLLAIKYEPEFDAYESKNPTQREINDKEINYKRFYFTTDKWTEGRASQYFPMCAETKVCHYFPKSAETKRFQYFPVFPETKVTQYFPKPKAQNLFFSYFRIY